MNKTCHRIVFNRSRGQLMAVQETARGTAPGSAGEAGPARSTGSVAHRRARFARRLLAWAAVSAAACGALTPSWAQHEAAPVTAGLPGLPATPRAQLAPPTTASRPGVVASPTAATGAKPIVDAAANGVTLVHIAPPSAGGVSHNQFNQFNVDARGLIFNNSPGSVQSQLGGWIIGNPQLGYVPARLILSEVTGTGPSLLQGPLEVAGRRADVVVANPNGLTCDGCGFINTTRATLTTGTPTFNAAGALTGLDVRQGQLGIGSGGLNASELQQLDLVARGIAVEGTVWAQRLRLLAGASLVPYAAVGDAPPPQPQPGLATGPAPTFAIELRDLGALYAQDIFLLATDKGLGVNSTGRMAALQGSLQLASNGDLTLKDSYASAGIRATSAGNLTLTGLTQTSPPTSAQTPQSADGTQGDIQLQAGGILAQHGSVDATGALGFEAGTIDNRGSLVQRSAARPLTLQASGSASNSGGVYSAGDIALGAATLVDHQGQWLAGQSFTAAAQAITLTGTAVRTGADARLAASDGDLNAAQASIQAGGHLLASASGLLANTEGLWQARGDVRLQAATLSNANGTVLAGGTLAARTPGQLDNTGGRLMGSAGVVLDAGHLANNASATRPAVVASDEATRITAARVDNLGGVLSAKTTLELAVSGTLDNTQGIAVSDDALQLRAADAVNRAGQIVARGTLGRALQLHADSLTNDAGLLSANGAAALAVTGTLSNRGGAIVAGNDTGPSTGSGTPSLDLQAGLVDNAGGQISAGAHLLLQAQRLTNTAGGSLAAQGDATLRVDRAENLDGSRIAAHRIDLRGTGSTGVVLNNRGSGLGSATDMNVQAGALSNIAGTLNAGGALTVTADSVQNSADAAGASSVIAAGTVLDISARSVSNSDGSALTAGQALSIDSGAGVLDNRGGRIGAQTQLALHAAQLLNRAGQIVANDTLQIRADGSAGAPGVDNRDGIISAGRQALLRTPQSVDNTRGQLTAGTALDLHAASLDNTQGQVGAAHTALDLGQGQLLNAAGRIAGTQSLRTTQGRIDNQGGTLATGGNLSVDTQGQDFTSAGGSLVAGGALTLHTADLDNTGGRLIGNGRIDVQARALTNTDGEISSLGDVNLTSQSLANGGQGKLAAGGALAIHNATTLGNSGTLSSAAGMVLASTSVDNAGTLQSGAGLSLNATQRLANTGQILANGNTTVHAGSLTQDHGALLAAQRALTVQVDGALINHGASALQSQGALQIAAASVANDAGEIASASALTLNVASTLSNRGGDLKSATDLTAVAAQIDNAAGRITAGGALHLQATVPTGAIGNASGSLMAGTTALLRADVLDNSAGTVTSGQNLDLRARQLRNNAAGRIVAGGDASLVVPQLDNSGGVLASHQVLSVQSDSVNNAGGRLEAMRDAKLSITGSLANAAGQLTSGAALDLSAAQIGNAGGLITATGRAQLTAQSLHNSQAGQISAATLSIQGGVDNHAGGLINSRGDLSLDTRNQALDNRTGSLQAAKSLTVASADLDNTQGQLLSGAALTLTSADLNNTGGEISSTTGPVSLTAAQLTNARDAAGAGGLILSQTAQLSVQASGIDNNAGTMAAGTTVAVASGGAVQNTAGRIQAGSDLTLNSTRLSQAQAAVMTAAGTVTLTTTGALSNQGRSVMQAGQALDVHAASVTNNTAGTIASGAALNVTTSGALDNTAGTVQSGQALTLRAASITNAAGQIDSRQAMRLDTSGVGALGNPGGQINAAGPLVAEVGALDNRRGTLASAVDLTLTSASLNNAAGVLSARGAMALTTGDLDNSQGAIGAQGPVALQAGALTNTGGKLTSGTTLNVIAQSLANDGGSVVSGADATLTLGQLTSNASGTLAAGSTGAGALTLHSSGVANNTQGLVQAAGALDLGAASVSNTQGQIVAGHRLTVQTGDLNNDQGRIHNLAGSARVTAAALNNGSGTIASGGDLALSSTQINSTGLIGAAQALDLSAQNLTHSGTLQSGADMRLQLTGVLNNAGSGANITAGGALRVDAAGLSQDAGARLLAAQSATLQLSGGLLNHGNSHIQSQGALDLAAAAVDNAAGTLASGAGLSLTSAGALTNASGTIYAGQGATLRAATIDNTGGLIQADQAVSLDTTRTAAPAGALVNAAGTVVAGTTLSVLAGDVNNRAGTMGSVGGLTLQTAALDNTGGQLQSRGAATLQSATLLNVGGSITTDRALHLSATRLDNTGGRVSAGTTLDLTLAQDLSNAAGHVTSAQDAVLHFGSLATNAAGAITANGTLTLHATGALNNQGGSIVAAQALDVSGAGLDNRQGTLASTQGAVRLDTQGQALSNDGGLLLAADALTVRSAALSNQAGVLRGASLDLTAADLDNRSGLIAATTATAAGAVVRASGAVNNDGGTLQSQAALTLRAASLSNASTLTSGGLLANGTLDVNVTGPLDNRAGYIGSGGSQTLAAGQTLDNSHGGQIVSAADASLQAATLDNSAAGSIQAHGNLTLAATGTLDNTAGAIASDATLSLKAPTVLNTQAGTMNAQDITWAGTRLDNHPGRITASHDLTVNGQSIANDGGTLSATNALSLTTPVFSNAGGSVLAGQSLRLDLGSGASVTPLGGAGTPATALDGTVSSGGDLTLHFAGDFSNDGQLSAGRDFSLQAANVHNRGTFHAGQDLTVTASSAGSTPPDGTVSNTGELSAGRHTTLNALTLQHSGAGVIDATGTTTLNVGTLDNSARIYGGNIAANASNAFNNSGAGSVMSRSDLSVIAPSITSTGGALIYADGDMSFGSATSGPQTLTNSASRIEAAGNLTFTDTAVSNLNVGLTTGTQTTTSTTPRVLYKPLEAGFDSSTWLDTTTLHQLIGAVVPGDGNLRISGWVLPSTTYPTDTFGWTVYQAAYTTAQCGSLQGGYVDCSHGNYAFDDPVWARFNVPSPSRRPVPPTPAGGCPDGDASAACVALADYTAAVRQDYAALQAAFTAFNYDLAYHRAADDWIERQVSTSTTTETVVTNPGQPGQILAGGNITLAGSSSVLNDSSQIVAGGRLQGNVTSLVNRGVQGTRTVASAGTEQSFHQHTWGSGCCSDIQATSAATPYTDPGTTTSFTLASYTVQELGGGAVSRSVGSGSSTGGTAAPSAAQAAQTALKGANAAAGQASTEAVQQASVSATQRSVDAGQQAATSASLAPGLATPGDGYRANGVTADAAVALTATGARSSAPPATVIPTVAAVSVSVAGHNAGTAELGATMAASRSLLLSQVTTPLAAANGAPTIQILSLPGSTERARDVVLTTAPNLRLPANAVFTLDTRPGADVLVETDPRFTNYRSFLGSDYFLQALQLDPSRTMKRLGDGYYEQREVADAVLALTGQRFLSGYADTEAEFKALMDSGVAFAKQYQLTPGVALTAEQMALLTTDIVWLTTQTVTLPDGSTTQVLAPQVYLRRTGSDDLQASGALIAASHIDVKSTGDLVNDNATLQASGTMLLHSDMSVSNLGGRLAAANLDVSAAQDVLNRGGQMSASGVLQLTAGRDILLQTTTQTTSADFAAGSISHTAVDRVATLQGGTVSLTAARDLLAQGAQLDATQDLFAGAGRDLTVSAVQGGDRYEIALGGHVEGRAAYDTSSTVTQTGSQVKAGGNVTMVAGGNLALRGADLTAGQNVGLQGANVDIAAAKASQSSDAQAVMRNGYTRAAQSDETLVGGTVGAGNNLSVKATGSGADGNITLTGVQLTAQAGQAELIANRDVTVQAATTEHSTANESYRKSSGLLSTKTTTQSSSSQLTQVEGSTVSGHTVLVQAGRDANAVGSNVVADSDVVVTAARNINVVTNAQSADTSGSASSTKSGLMGAGTGVMVGTREQGQASSKHSTEQVGSVIGSLSGSVTMTAGETYTQTGSTIQTPKGNVDVLAQKVTIDAATSTSQSHDEQHFKQSGLSVSVSTPVISAVESATQTARAAGRTSDSRMQALAAASVALSSKDAVAGAQGLAQDPSNAGIGINLSLGSSRTASATDTVSTTAQGSRINAGGTVTIRATGAGQDSTLSVIGSDISAGGRVSLKADGAVNLEAAQNTAEQHSQNSASSGSIGVGLNFGGSQNGLSFNASASKSRGHADGTDTTWSNTHVSGAQVDIQSGGDTTLKGAVITADRVTGQVGGNLHIESLQDTSTYAAQQQSAGVGVSVCVPPLCAGASTASVSVSKAKVDGSSASVTEQSGIKTGDGGFELSVKGSTDLKGGVIESSQAAVDAGRNTLTTASITTTDIQNHDHYDASSVSVGGGMGSSGKPGFAPGIGSASGSQGSTTKSGISQGAIALTDGSTAPASLDRSVTTDRDASGALKKNWNGQTLMSDVQAQSQIMQTALPQIANEIGTRMDAKVQELKAQGNEAEAARYAEGGAYRIAAHATLGALGGGVGGALGAGASSAAAPTFNDLQANLQTQLTGSGMSAEAAQGVAKLLTGGAAAALGAVVSGGSTVGTATAANADFNNRQLHPQERSLIEKLAKDKASQSCKPGDTACINSQTLFWTDTMERVASALVDDEANAKNAAYLAQLAKASNSPNSEGAQGLLQSYVDALRTAQGMLTPYMGKTITVNGQTASANGSPQTYFSATAPQKADPYGNYLLGSKPDSIAPLKNLRDEERVERFGALNGAATQDTSVEAMLLGGKVAEKAIGAVGKLLGGESDVAFAGTVEASRGGNISASKISKEGLPVKLSQAESTLLRQLDSLPTTQAQGALREYVADNYYLRNGFTSLDGKCGSNCFDGVYVKDGKLFINEVKPLNSDGTISLSSNSGSKIGTQMEQTWIESRARELLNGTPSQRETGSLILKALEPGGGGVTRVVTGVSSNGITIVKLPVLRKP